VVKKRIKFIPEILKQRKFRDNGEEIKWHKNMI
jgi:hypothetical protein